MSSKKKNTPYKFFNLIKGLWTLSLFLFVWSYIFKYKFPSESIFIAISTSQIFIILFSFILFLSKKEMILEKVSYFFIGIILLFIFQGWMDVPAYLTQNYKVVKGVPSIFERDKNFRGGVFLHVKIKDIDFELPSSIQDSQVNKTYVIYYLPHSKYVIKYKILPNKPKG